MLHRTPNVPPWDQIDPNALSKRGVELVTAAIHASNDAIAATLHGNGLTEAEVEMATAADVWRVATLCREADATAGTLRDELYAEADDTVATIRRFAEAAIAASDSYADTESEALSARFRLEAARYNPPESKILADILEKDQDTTKPE